MIERTILDYLSRSAIPGIGSNVYMEVPRDRKEKYIVIERTGSGRTNRLNRATVAVQSIVDAGRGHLEDAAELNEAVKQKMLEMPDTENVFGVELSTDYNFTNPETKEYRYQAIFSIYY